MDDLLRIRDIETRDILYYEPDLAERCYEFCKAREIDCLPALDRSFDLYVRDDATRAFQRQACEPDRIVEAYQLAFDPAMLPVLARYRLLLVRDHGELDGVIHFTDFNKEVVSRYLYALFYRYERALRSLLALSGYHNADLLRYIREMAQKAETKEARMHYGGRKGDYHTERFQEKLRNSPAFQPFYLDDLIDFANATGSALDPRVVELRNMVMHSHEMVNKQDWDANGYIFEFSVFEQFFGQALALQADDRRVRNKVALLTGHEDTEIVV